jgi:hypothetical protein
MYKIKSWQLLSLVTPLKSPLAITLCSLLCSNKVDLTNAFHAKQHSRLKWTMVL